MVSRVKVGYGLVRQGRRGQVRSVEERWGKLRSVMVWQEGYGKVCYVTEVCGVVRQKR